MQYYGTINIILFEVQTLFTLTKRSSLKFPPLRSFFFIPLFLLGSLLSNELSAQISASTTEGCAPLTNVLFSHSYSGATNINWTFGDGASSNLAAPTHTFVLPNTYTVVFTATVGGSPVTQQLTITVHGLPQASFTINGITNGCVGLQVSFTDNSTGGGGSSISTWSWAYGDGGVNSINTATPTYQYNVAGIFDVGVIVTDANGCSASSIQEGEIIISGLPAVNITTNPTPASACVPPLVVSFNGNASSNSPLTDNLTYAWNLGNGETSTAAIPPTITYDETGNYIILLTVTDDNDCSRMVNSVVSVSEPIANFTVVGAENDTVCSHVNFINNSVGTNPVFQYGDGISGDTLWHDYNAAGWYDVTLTVNNNQCQDDTTISIYVQVPTVIVNIVPAIVCQYPVTFQVSAIPSHPVATYFWTLPDGTTSSQATASGSYTYQETEYLINQPQFPTANLVITTTDGCTAAGLNNFEAAKPNALFYPDMTEGCAPLQLVFYDSSHTTYSNIIQWKWHFDDGTPPLTAASDADVPHTYQNEGIYHPYLVVVTANGCRDTSWLHTISVGTLPNASFTISPSTICPGDVIQITNTTPLADSVDTWNYNGDNNLLFSCQDEHNPQVTFLSETGTSTITMTAGYRGCYATATQQVTVHGPVGKLKYSCNCDTPLIYPFQVEVSDADHWTYDFGDGVVTSNSTATNISHTYPASGDYWAVLTSYNTSSGCAPSVDSLLIRVRQVEAIINIPDSICRGEEYDFSTALSIDGAAQEGSCHNSFIWDFGDGTPPKTTKLGYPYTYETSGTYTVELFSEDVNGCIDSTSKTVRVFGINADFTMSYASVCLPLAVQLNATGTADLGISDYQWSFNDNTTATGQSTSHTFTDPIYNANNVLQRFYITLEAIDEAGCVATVTDSIQPSIPNSNFSNLTPTGVCEGGSVTLKPQIAAAGNQFLWDFGDGTTSTQYQTTHAFEDVGFYTIQLTVTNAQGCSHTKVTPNMIQVQAKPIAAFMSNVPNGETICYPAQLTFTDTSIVNPFGSRTWNLGNGAPTIGSVSIGANYNQPGEYTIILIERTTAGCADTTSMTIQVEGPQGSFALSPATICRGAAINLSITDTTDVATWQWDYGDGTNGGQVYTHSHDYDYEFNPASGQTVVSLVLWNPDSACSAVVTRNVNFVDARAGFKRNNELTAQDSIHCVGIADIFTNTSTSNINQWSWNFGNGQTANNSTPPPITYQPGTYDVRLAVRTLPAGCVDTLIKTMVIHPLPVVTTTGGEICVGDNLTIGAEGGEEYVWTPSVSLDDETLQNPIAFPDITTVYTVSVTDTNDCVNTGTATVVVYQPIVSVYEEHTLIIGETLDLNVYQGEGYTYQWSPNYNISCLDCAQVTVQPLEDTTYSVIITDNLGCFTDTSYFKFIILPYSSVDVPDVFTPNGDGINDIIYVRGWGIEELHYFKIFNRWGELVFESNDLDIGWNGYYKEKLQMADTYTYTVSAKPYIQNAPVLKSGFINIVR